MDIDFQRHTLKRIILIVAFSVLTGCGILGDLGESFLSSQYSQKQEYAADEYGFKFSSEHGYSPYSMGTALEKLVTLAGSSNASLVQKMFSSHPDSAERARRMRAKADAQK